MEDQSCPFDKISEPYYFESDHVALKENTDYRSLLHTIALLEAQRQQAAEDLEILYRAKDAALSEPIDFVKKLQKSKDVGFPLPQKIAELPDIAWEKYTNNANFSYFATSHHKTRNKKNVTDDNIDQIQSFKSKLLQGLPTSSQTSSTSSNAPESDCTVVRGRTKDSSKSATFNQLWTEEEQQRLENLLVEFPPEEVEARRWAKIAEALGNRTPIQVASRVQKYFVRLAKEGLPIPGRMPNLASHTKKSGGHRHHRYNRMYCNSSTFMQSHIPPVWMQDDGGDMDSPSGTRSMSEVENSQLQTDYQKVIESSDEEDYPEDILASSEYQELQQLKRLRNEKLQQERNSHVQHVGYKCDRCGIEPIVGTRWNCIDCPDDISFDFCDNCSIIPFQQDKHDSSHRLNPVKHDVLDSDYMSYSKANYNYLDSNFMPAN